MTEAQTKEVLELQPQQITLSLLISYFADTGKSNIDKNGIRKTGRKKARFNTYDKLTVPANYFYKSQPEIKTTIGRFIANKFVLQGDDIIGTTKYQNCVWDGDFISSFSNTVADYLLKDLITKKQFTDFLDRRDTIGFWLNGMLAHSISPKMAKPIPEIEKMKADLIKKHQKEIESGDLDVMLDIQDQLVKRTKEILKGDPGMDLYDSGNLNFSNNYRANSIIKGPVKNAITGQFDFIDTSFMNGIKIKDLPAHANSVLASQYPVSIATKDSGYLGKKLLSLMQMIDIGPEGSDCGTKQLIPLTITNHNAKDVVYTWIKQGEKEILLTPDNIKSYIGKTVMMRSPMTCLDDKICSKCAGQLFYMLGVKNVGLYSVQISYSDLNLSMKTKHDTTVKVFSIDPETSTHKA